jgi:hypothetical protein
MLSEFGTICDRRDLIMNDEIHISLSIPTDDEGYVLLRCEHCGTFFKGMPSDIQDDGVLRIYCPSCGLTSDSYITEDVLELAQNTAKNRVSDMIYEMFKAGRRPRHESEDPIRSSIEALDTCTFPCCARTAKVKPLLKMTGAYCPFCGVKNYEIE